MESQSQSKGSDTSGSTKPRWFLRPETAPKEKYVQNWTLAYYIETVSKELILSMLKNCAKTQETLKFYQSKKCQWKSFKEAKIIFFSVQEMTIKTAVNTKKLTE